jgi:type II secretory pathway pseudopilin PulG
VPFCAYCGSQIAEVSYRPCPACGNPANGAPRPQLGTGGSNVVLIAIGAVVFGLVAIAIAGILAAIAIPNLLTAMQRSKQKRTMAEMRILAQDVERRASTAGAFPAELETTSRDGWGTALRYECVAENDRPCAGYAITSAGKDKAFEHDSAGEYSQGSTDKFDCDIVLANGTFVQYPEGAQR